MLFDFIADVVHQCTDPWELVAKRIEGFKLIGTGRDYFSEVAQTIAQTLIAGPPIVHFR
ncbi:hypothetical protein D3C84_1276160 [compost metagenome]